MDAAAFLTCERKRKRERDGFAIISSRERARYPQREIRSELAMARRGVAWLLPGALFLLHSGAR